LDLHILDLTHTLVVRFTAKDNQLATDHLQMSILR
jgi:hypothetical protein